MARKIMGGDFRAIPKTQPVAAEPDPRLALVDLFVNGQAAPQGFVDLSGGEDPMVQEAWDLLEQPLVEDAQEAAGAPVGDTGADGPVEAATAVDEAPVQPEPVSEPEPPESKSKDDDYDPIAAVLG